MNYRSPLIQCSNSVDASEYQGILERSEVIEEMNKRYGRGQWTLMQDGAPCHLARTTLEWLDSQHVCTVPGWPPNSPDLNPIEQVWGIMKVLLRRNPPKNNNELYTRLCDVWAAITKEQINKLVGSFLERCRLVLALDGRSASQHLSSHRSVELLEPPPPTWDEATDTYLQQLVEELGTRWTRIGGILGCRPMSAKNRYNLLSRAKRNRLERERPELPSIHELDVPRELAEWNPFADL